MEWHCYRDGSREPTVCTCTLDSCTTGRDSLCFPTTVSTTNGDHCCVFCLPCHCLVRCLRRLEVARQVNETSRLHDLVGLDSLHACQRNNSRLYHHLQCRGDRRTVIGCSDKRCCTNLYCRGRVGARLTLEFYDRGFGRLPRQALINSCFRKDCLHVGIRIELSIRVDGYLLSRQYNLRHMEGYRDRNGSRVDTIRTLGRQDSCAGSLSHGSPAVVGGLGNRNNRFV